MPRYSISNAPTKIDFSYQDPGNFGVKWGICMGLYNDYDYDYDVCTHKYKCNIHSESSQGKLATSPRVFATNLLLPNKNYLEEYCTIFRVAP